MEEPVKRIAFAGAGNVAWHLAQAFSEAGFSISGVWSRDKQNSEKLASLCNSKSFEKLKDLQDTTDLILITVPDKAIAEVAENFAGFNGIVAHTAGSVNIAILEARCRKAGVMYPLQTFTKDVFTEMADVPFFIESALPEVREKLQHTALKLSQKVHFADSAKRLTLHVAAVFAGNYSNLMYTISRDLLERNLLPADALNPLIKETARKAILTDPYHAQTGPARRSDTETLKKHFNALIEFPEYADLYQQLSEIIQTKYKPLNPSKHVEL